MSRYFGIDFGTTTTAFVCFDDETRRYEKIEDPASGQPFHSIVVLDTQNGRIFDRGNTAWQNRFQYASDPELIMIGLSKENFLRVRSGRPAILCGLL
jgi:molecular chaperone DnaK (HSP70)